MTKASAEMMREFVKSQNFTTTDEVMTAMMCAPITRRCAPPSESTHQFTT